MTIKHWERADIVRWHKSTFPHCSADEQLKKLAEEAKEYYLSTTPADKLEEAADVYIAATVLWRRYGEPLGNEMCVYISGRHADIMSAVDCKMAVNTKRAWKNNRHVA